MSVQPFIQQVGIDPYAYVQNSSHIVDENSMTGGGATMPEWNAQQARVIEELRKIQGIFKVYWYPVAAIDYFAIFVADDDHKVSSFIAEAYVKVMDEYFEYLFEFDLWPLSYENKLPREALCCL